MMLAARWYAVMAAAGMPCVDALEITPPGDPGVPRPMVPGTVTLAGTGTGSDGSALPSGRERSAALAPPVSVSSAVQAADTRVSGIRTAARCHCCIRAGGPACAPTGRFRGRRTGAMKTPPSRAGWTKYPGNPVSYTPTQAPAPRRTLVAGRLADGLRRVTQRTYGSEFVVEARLGDNGRVTSASTPGSAALFARARAVTPGGVNSPVRAFNAVGGTPRFIESAKGAYLTDVDGNRYVDLVCSWGPMLLGHAHPEVMAAVSEAVARGTSYGTPTRPEVELAEEIVARTPVEKVRLVSSGTEATMSAIRLARGFTGRDLVVKFAGCYHGHVDSLLAEAGSGRATPRSEGAVPGTPGVPAASTAATLVLPYNDREAVEAAFAERGSEIACLVTEAAPGNMGVVPPEPGFNQFLAETCRTHGALFVSDEVMTGFRVSRQGQWGRDGAVEGWRPDLVTFGKVMGGGFPAAAFGGRADVMGMLSPDGPVYQAGTLSGNPVATTAGLATLRLATDDVYAHLTEVGTTLKEAAAAALSEAGVPHCVQSAGTMFSVFFTEGPVRDFEAAQRQDTAAFAAFFHAMLDHGVYLPPSAYEAWFVSAAHDVRAVQTVLDALPAAARAAAATVPEGTHGCHDDRPPAAPRRGAQPRGRPLRPPRRLPPVRAGPRDGATRRRHDRRARHRPPADVPAGAGAGDRRPPGRGAQPGPPRRPSGDRVRQRLRGQAVRARRQRSAQAVDLGPPVEPLEAVVGRALPRGHCPRPGRRVRRARRCPRSRGRHRLPPAADL